MTYENKYGGPGDPHPLVVKILHVGFLKNWSEWLDRWVVAKDYETLYGLLHIGYGVPHEPETPEKQLVFYMRVADGHTNLHGSGNALTSLSHEYMRETRFTNTFGRKSPVSVSETLVALASKAFQVLADNIFKLGDEEEQYKNLAWRVFRFGVLDTVLWFFRTNEDAHIMNLHFRDGDDRDKVCREAARNFALRLCTLAFEDESSLSSRDGSAIYLRAKLAKRRAELIPILHALGKVELLSWPRYAAQVDAESVQALRRLMRSRQYRLEGERGFRSPNTIEEGCCMGCSIARTLLVLRARQQGSLRLSE